VYEGSVSGSRATVLSTEQTAYCGGVKKKKGGVSMAGRDVAWRSQVLRKSFVLSPTKPKRHCFGEPRRKKTRFKSKGEKNGQYWTAWFSTFSPARNQRAIIMKAKIHSRGQRGMSGPKSITRGQLQKEGCDGGKTSGKDGTRVGRGSAVINEWAAG